MSSLKIWEFWTNKRKDNDLTNNNFYPWDSQEDFIQQRILTTYRDFYYKTGRFPGRTTLIPVPRARGPDFIQSQDVLSPRSLYENYVGRDMQGIVSLQFLAAFNRFLGGDKEVSRNAMSELFHNLSWQALTNDNDSIQVQFEAVTALVQSINRLIQKQIYEQKKEQIQRGREVIEELTRKEKEDNKTEIEKIEEKVVNDIIQNDQTDYTPYFEPPAVKTEEKIDEDRKEWNKQFLEGELAKNERDFEIIEDIEAKNKVDLIKDAIDPGDGIFTNEETGHLDYTRTERNEPAAPQLDPSVLKGIGIFLQGMSQAVSEQTSDGLPELKYIPDVKYEEPEEIKPNLQDILTQPEPEDFIEDIKNIKEEVKTEVEDDENNDPLMQKMPEIFEDGEFDDTEFIQQYIPEFLSDQNRLDLDVRARTTHALVPTEIKVEDDDPAEILANLNVTTILPPISDGRIYVPLLDFDEIKPEITPAIKEEFVIPPPINIAPTAMAITPDQSENDSDIDFKGGGGGDVIRKIVAAILRTDKLMSESTSRSERRSLQKVKDALILYLRRIQANTLADALE